MTPCRPANNVQSGRSPTLAAHVRTAALKPLWIALAALLTGAPAYAIDYTFPGTLPPGCSQNADIGSNYTCGALTLSAGDTIVINGSAAVTVSGAMTIGANTLINAAGAASALNFQVAGTFGLGAGSTMHANVSTGESAADIAGSTKIIGNITTGNGVVTTSASVDMTGNIITTGGGSGTVNIGASNIIRGNISTVAGVVTTGAGSTTIGYIQTNAGAVNLGADNTVGDSITTQAGVVTIGANAVIGESGSGNISTAGGGVSVGDSSRMCGSLSTLAGVVTLGANIRIGANLTTSGGDITITGTITTGLTTIGGYLDAKAAGAVTLTQVLIGGSVNVAVGALTMTDTQVRGNGTYHAAYTPVRSSFNNGTVSFPAACSAAVVPPPAAVAASFDALETGLNAPWSASARRALYTKLVDVPFTFDIAALKTDGTLQSAYVGAGGASRYVKVELFDDAGAACSSYGSTVGSSFGGAVATQTLAFTTTFSTASGRTLGGPFTMINVHKALLVRITECTDGSCSSFSGTPAACSSDRFAVRPSAVTLSTTSDMAVAPSPTASQVLRAGAGFTLLAKSNPGGAYGGVLTQDSGKLSAQWPSEGAIAQSGGTVGVLKPSTLIANADTATATANANYNEVGYLYIGIGAYRDDNFTAIDSGVGDCITSTNNNAYLADTLIDGKYGCSIGNKAIASLGRFVPDHFSTVVVPGSTMPCPFGLTCPPSARFAYSGQPFALTITAFSANDTPTLNYTGLLARDVTISAWDDAGSTRAENPSGGKLGVVAIPAASFVNGVAIAKLAYTFPARYPVTAPIALAAPTDISLRAIETAGDGVSSLRSAPLVSLEGGIKIVSGRIKLDNTYGSELLTVPVVARVQYWDGFRFVASATDATTSFSAADIVRSDCKLRDKGKPLVADPACKIAPFDNAAPPPIYVMFNGIAQFKQAVPGAGYSGSADLSISSSTSPWLPSTKARIGVGVYKGGPVIYRREMF